MNTYTCIHAYNTYTYTYTYTYNIASRKAEFFLASAMYS